jgi:WD40 repeat protein
MSLASGGDDRVVRLWEAATLEPSLVFEGHTGRIRAIAFSPRAPLLASVGEDGATRIWDLDDPQGSQLVSAEVEACRVAFSSSGLTLATGYRDGSIRLFDVEQGQMSAELEAHSDVISSLVFLPDDQAFYSSSYDGKVFAWSARLPAQPALVRTPTEMKVWAK